MRHRDDTDHRHDDGDPHDRPGNRDCMRLLLERFPHVPALTFRSLLRDETFRELCDEYQACSEAAERHTHFDADEAMRKEYNALRLRLEGELLRYLSEHGRQPQ